MQNHISKHAWDKYPMEEEHIYQAVTDPDHARRSLDPHIGGESCVFEKFFPSVGPAGQRFFTAVLYDGSEVPERYEQGGLKGKVSTAYFPGDRPNSRYIGDIFWSKQEVLTTLAATSEGTRSVEVGSDADEEGETQ